MLVFLFVAFLLLLLVGFDVGFSMILAAFLGIQAKTDRIVDSVMMPLSMIAGVDIYALVQVPLFILAGELMNRGGLTQRLIDWSQTLVGQVRGSLGHVSIITNFVLSGVSGSAVADAVATGKPLIPAMKKQGYGEGYAGAVIAAGAARPDHSALDPDGGLCADRRAVGREALYVRNPAGHPWRQVSS